MWNNEVLRSILRGFLIFWQGVKDQYIADKVQGWCEGIKMLADFAESEPQAAY